MKNNKDKSSYILTRETLGMTVLLLSAIVLVMLLTGSAVFAGVGKGVCTFLYGMFGYGSYLIILALVYLGVWLVFEKRIKLPVKPTLAVALTVLVLFLLFHAVSTRSYELNGYGEYIKACYNNAELGFAGYTFGGLISALFVYPIAKGTTFIGAYIIFAILALLCVYLCVLSVLNAMGKKLPKREKKAKEKERSEPVREKPRAQRTEQPVQPYAQQAPQPYAQQAPQTVRPSPVQGLYGQTVYPENTYDRAPAANDVGYQTPYQPTVPLTPVRPAAQTYEEEIKRDEDKFSPKNLGRKILFENDEFAAESYRRNMIFNESSYFNNPVHNDDDYLKSFGDGLKRSVPAQNETYSSSYQDEVQNETQGITPSSYVYGDNPVDKLDEYTDQIHADSYKADEYEDLSNEAFGNPFGEPVNETEREAPLYRAPSYEEEEREERFDGDPFDRDEPVAPPQMPPEEPVPPVRQEPERFEQNARRDYGEMIGKEESKQEEPGEERGREDRNSLFNLFSASNAQLDDNSVQPDVSRLSSRREHSNANLFDEDTEDGEDELFSSDLGSLASPDRRVGTPREDLGDFGRRSDSLSDGNGRGEDALSDRSERSERIAPVRRESGKPSAPPPAAEKKEEKPKHVWKKYVRPPLDLLADYPDNGGINTGDIEETKQTIVETLVGFRIECEITNVVIGPAITRYDVVIKDKANIKNSLKYREAISMALKKENVNFYLNYAKGALSIEVPNTKRAIVGLKNMLLSQQFICCKPNSLTFTLGKNVDGETVCPDITKMPHLLVAGTTGSGKSICLNSLIVSLLYKYGPEELRFILVDPKQVEFICYDKLPHLMINEIIFDVDKAIKALNWAIGEMQRRYALFKEMTEQGVATKDLNEYNSHLKEGEEKLPKIVIILDEFGDLMMQAKKDIEGKIIRLVQKARACGIHLILATQRPSVDCITGLIKSNLPTRIGFKVGSFDDSRTIFDVGGAEKLLGKGDMYFRSAENPDLARIQGCFIDTPEVQKVTDFVKQNNETFFDQSVSDFINTVEEDPIDSGAGGGDSAVSADSKIDDACIKALHYCVMSNQASVSMLQRRFPIGYMKACKIVDWMESMNYITPSEGSKPRKVLLSKEEFINIYGDVDD